LFGSIYALTPGGSRLAAAIGLAVAVAVLLAVRPLLLATLDEQLATVRGIPARALGVAFLILLALVTAESTPAVGALLVLGLLAAPAGAAHRLTARPYRGLALSALIAVLAMWGGLALSYQIAALPPSSAIIGLAGAGYAAASVLGRLRSRQPV
jgi:zinc/manganese transport system permease protein